MARGMADDRQVRTQIGDLRSALDALLATQPCVTLKQLQVNGGDLLRLGYPKGPALGQALQALLDAVVDGAMPNEREQLLSHAQAMLRQ